MLGICTLMVCSCGKKIPTLSNGEEAVVTLSNGNNISVNELYNDLKNSYALDSLINLIDKKILEEKYKDRIESANEYTDGTMKSYEEYYGDQLLSVIQYSTSYSTIEAFRNYIYLDYLKKRPLKTTLKNKLQIKK